MTKSNVIDVACGVVMLFLVVSHYGLTRELQDSKIAISALTDDIVTERGKTATCLQLLPKIEMDEAKFAQAEGWPLK